VSTVRPSRTGAIGIVVVAVIGAIAVLVRTQWKGDDLGPAFVVGIVSIAATTIFAVVFMRNRRVDFEPTVIRTTSFLGTTRELPVASVGQIVIAPRIATTLGNDLEVFSVMDVADEPFARLNLTYWNLETLAAATVQYGDRVTILTEAMPKKHFVARYPRVLSYGMRHPYRTVLWFICAAIALGLAFAAFTENLG